MIILHNFIFQYAVLAENRGGRGTIVFVTGYQYPLKIQRTRIIKAELQHPGGTSLLSLRTANTISDMTAKLGKVVIEPVADIDHSDKKAILANRKQGGRGNLTLGDCFLFCIFLNTVQPVGKIRIVLDAGTAM